MFDVVSRVRTAVVVARTYQVLQSSSTTSLLPPLHLAPRPLTQNKTNHSETSVSAFSPAPRQVSRRTKQTIWKQQCVWSSHLKHSLRPQSPLLAALLSFVSPVGGAAHPLCLPFTASRYRATPPPPPLPVYYVRLADRIASVIGSDKTNVIRPASICQTEVSESPPLIVSPLQYGHTNYVVHTSICCSSLANQMPQPNASRARLHQTMLWPA